MGHVHKLLV